MRLCFGGGDYTRDIGVGWTRDEEECFTARSIIVMAARANDLPAPIDSVYIDIDDADALQASTRRAKQLGFRGKFVIHPSQVEIVNRVFTPTESEVRWAERVIAGLEQAEASGAGAFVVDGRMIDYPIIESARQVIAVSGEIAASGSASSTTSERGPKGRERS